MFRKHALEVRTGWRGLGLVPYFEDASRLPAEDSQALMHAEPPGPCGRPLVAVLAYPRMSNFDDFDPLRLEPGLDVVFLHPRDPIPASASLVILPGSKATMADLAALRAAGWDVDLSAYVRRGGRVLGICGGYQMLGKRIADPDGIEGSPGVMAGLGLLDVDTVLAGKKSLREIEGVSCASGAAIRGYIMHVGRTAGAGLQQPMIRFREGCADGAVSQNGRVAGCSVHGLFSNDAYRASLLEELDAPVSELNYESDVETTLDALAAHIEAHVDCNRILDLAR